MASDIFLKIDGIDGESKDDKHANEIEIHSLQWSMSQAATMHAGTGGGAGKVSIDDLVITHAVDKASPILMQSCMSGKHIPKAVLTVRKAGEKPLDYYKITMTDVMISSVSPAGANNGNELLETVGLAFSKVKIEYQPQGADGAASGGAVVTEWDIKANKKV
ncbi:type VI secretion system secreted protein Hcp [Andreprevotia lacus DSM 23236]|jgi:type VI secretion system secreted protein Hcp|uniref:Type VI secretion system secreted protein Hcp n=1 Tax=Andreprevotia lacus DSM 23236 TaxID=1121001 RepID=A0A1W1XLX8_9NEIS|nr:type VI secretion system tube protein Hcp [Andreprevotia lacus]SMC24990.1 type VI secretion system secreted protein Hcp [Andreprevotia lacus DSM 23236]